MDAIKKKMQSLKTETENAMARADQLDAEFRAATTLAEKTEETVSNVWGKHKIYDVSCLGERSPEKDAACRE
jgi:hypothetical protein